MIGIAGPVGRLLIALVLAAAGGTAAAPPAAAADVWRHEPGPRGGEARVCSPQHGQRICAVVACGAGGGLIVGVDGWRPRAGDGDMRTGWIGVDGWEIDTRYRRARGHSLWQAELGRATPHVIRRMKEGYDLGIGIARDLPAFTFGLDNSYSAIERLERRCDAPGPSSGAPTGAVPGGIAGLFLEQVLEAVEARGRPSGPDPRPDRLGPRWERLGSLRASRERGRDVIRVGAGAGRFDALRLWVSDNDLELARIFISYANGDEERITPKRRLSQGTLTREIRLRGREGRAIESVTLVHATRGRGPRARIELWARHSEGAGRPGLGRGWEPLGSARMDRWSERAVFRLGPGAGRLAALRLRVRGGDVLLREVIVRYGSGAVERLRPGRRLEAGDLSEVLELPGRRGRLVESVTLIHAPGRAGPGARVELWGRSSG